MMDIPLLDEWFDGSLTISAKKITVFGISFIIFFALFDETSDTNLELITCKCQHPTNLLNDIQDREDGPGMQASIELSVFPATRPHAINS
jgi:hypothetical protein